MMKKRTLGLLTALTILLGGVAPSFAAAQSEAADRPPVPDGQYLAQVELQGGTGRARIDSPTLVTMADGRGIAMIRWSSRTYDFMRLAGETYLTVRPGGNATFLVPVTLDTLIPFEAQTSAMSQPHIIEYTLRVSGEGLRPLPTFATTVAGSAAAGASK